jgi:hypothetical protein
MRYRLRSMTRGVSPGIAFAILVLSGCAANAGGPFNQKPYFIRGEILETRHDGPGDDLLTAGLGRSGLAAATSPAVSDPPTWTSCAGSRSTTTIGRWST